MKVCSICKIQKDVTQFYKKKNGVAHRCLECEVTYQQQYYANNKEKRIKAAREHAKKQQQVLRKYVVDYLKQNPCVDCGQSNILTLQFDHRDGKLFDISKAVCSGRPISLTKLISEISKCDVRCANCHQIKTVNQFGWWKLEYTHV